MRPKKAARTMIRTSKLPVAFAAAAPFTTGTFTTYNVVGDANGNYGSPHIGWFYTTCKSSDHGYRDRSAEGHVLCDPSAA